jgi:hypothetical protein
MRQMSAKQRGVHVQKRSIKEKEWWGDMSIRGLFHTSELALKIQLSVLV